MSLWAFFGGLLLHNGPGSSRQDEERKNVKFQFRLQQIAIDNNIVGTFLYLYENPPLFSYIITRIVIFISIQWIIMFITTAT